MSKQLDVVFPPRMQGGEAVLIRRRRAATEHYPGDTPPAGWTTSSELPQPVEPVRDAVGIAISGGGVRSATFALGVFQALAKHKFLRSVDYLSTVSGGGYFGGFFTALFARRGSGKRWHEVEETLSGSKAIRYLRENGRYLAPAGSDDLWLLISVVLRNWIAVLLALSSALGLLYLGLELTTVRASAVAAKNAGIHGALAALASWGDRHQLVLSPWLLLVPVLLVLGAIPLGWAYWLSSAGALAPLVARISPAERNARATRWQQLLQAKKVGTFVVLGSICTIAYALLEQSGKPLTDPGQAGHVLGWIVCAALAAETVSRRDGRDARPIAQGLVLFTFAAVALTYLAVFELCALGVHAFVRRPELRMPAVFASTAVSLGLAYAVARAVYHRTASYLQAKWRTVQEPSEGDQDHFSRHALSLWLTRCLIFTAAIAAIAIVQSISRTLYAHAGRDTLLAFFASTFAAAFGAQSVGRRVMGWLSSGSTEKNITLSGTLAAYAAGLGLALALVIATTTALLLTIYPACDAAKKPATSEVHLCVSGDQGVLCDESPVMMARAAEDGSFTQCAANLVGPEPGSVAWAALVLAVLCLVLGSSHVFLNSSSQLPIYTARITRTFLGASNPDRLAPARPGNAPASKLAPSAELIASQQAATQLMPGDDLTLGEYWSGGDDGPYERGAPLHIINVTINETVDGRSRTQQADRKGLGLAVGPCGLSAGVRHHAILRWTDQDRVICETTQADASFRVFDYKAEDDDEDNPRRVFDGESLSIGRWLGISGAAFSTGTGYRTNVGMSLLAGLANVRLGYWWDAGVRRSYTLWRIAGVLLWTHQYLRRELLARFPGVANKLWYLSDGGHFENTGAYELIRRRAARIVVLDAGCDPDYTLEDLGNLVRKARLDFGVEIEFLEHGAISDHIRRDARKYVGTLAELARPDRSKPSTVHAALARVIYPNNEGEGLLLFVKPTITGGEPADIARYHAEHPDFPHESTLDQFFGESQWESYRALGEQIGTRLFIGPYGPFRGPATAIAPKP